MISELGKILWYCRTNLARCDDFAFIQPQRMITFGELAVGICCDWYEYTQSETCLIVLSNASGPGNEDMTSCIQSTSNGLLQISVGLLRAGSGRL